MNNYPKAPEARVAKTFGIGAVVSAFVCFPVAIPLSILAIRKNIQAKKMSIKNPNIYQAPGNTGIILGIIALGLVPIILIMGFICASMLVSRLTGVGLNTSKGDAEVRQMMFDEKVKKTRYYMEIGLSDLVELFNQSKMQHLSKTQTLKTMQDHLVKIGQTKRSPETMELPAYNSSIIVVEGMSKDDLDTKIQSDISIYLWGSVYILQFPVKSEHGVSSPGFIAGVVRVDLPLDKGTKTFVKIEMIE